MYQRARFEAACMGMQGCVPMAVASASADCTARIWDAQDGSCVGLLDGHTDFVTELAWSRSAQLLATGALDGTARLWCMSDIQRMHDQSDQVHAATGWECRAVLQPHNGRVTCLVFVPDDRTLATGKASPCMTRP